VRLADSFPPARVPDLSFHRCICFTLLFVALGRYPLPKPPKRNLCRISTYKLLQNKQLHPYSYLSLVKNKGEGKLLGCQQLTTFFVEVAF
jgi:hypothetical protein